jgi:hypothetical protein
MDILNLSILEDGTVTVKTSEISDGNHLSADKLLENLETMLGGQVIKRENPERRSHVHIGTKAHAH